MKIKSEKVSSLTRRSLPSFCFGFIALTSNSDKSWSFPVRAKLAKLSRSLNRSLRKLSLIFYLCYENDSHLYSVLCATLIKILSHLNQEIRLHASGTKLVNAYADNLDFSALKFQYDEKMISTYR